MNAHNGNKRHRHIFWRILDWFDYIFVGLVLIVVITLFCLTWWLTPQRLSEIVDYHASKALNADISTGNISFTFWSTFPHFCIEADSLNIRSHNLDNIDDSIRHKLPSDPDFLLSTGKIKGGINIAKLLKGEIWLRDVNVESINLNLVAVNDSVNNYSLVPPSNEKTSIPYFKIDRLLFTNGGDVHYFSLPSNSAAHVALNEASLMPQKNKNDYHLKFIGKIFANTNDFEILRGFPFELDGNIHFRFKPFGISASDYAVNLGQIKGRMGMDMDMDDDVKLNKFDYHLAHFSLNDLRMLLPNSVNHMLKRLDADVEIEANAQLTSPYNFSSAMFPSFEVNLLVPDGEVGYTFSDNNRYTIDNVMLKGRFVFNGANPDLSYVDIPELRLQGLGVNVFANGHVTNLTSNPHVIIKLQGKSDLGYISRNIKILNDYNFNGMPEFNIGLSFDLIDSRISSPELHLGLKSDNFKISLNGYDFNLDGMEATTDEKYDNALTWIATTSEIPLKINMKARQITVENKLDSVLFSASSLNADANLSKMLRGDVMRKIDISLKGADLVVKTKKFSTGLNGIDLAFSAFYLDSPYKCANFVIPDQWISDEQTMTRVDHSPQFVKFDVSEKAKNLIDHWRASLAIKSGEGEMSIDGYNLGVNNLDLNASLDSIVVNNASLSHGDTRGDLKAKITNLRQFLVSSKPAPINVDADIALDTVQINQLAHDFAVSHPNSAVSRGDKKGMEEGIDTVSIIIPRNITGHVHATAMQTRYTNLHLYDLMTDVSVQNGIARVDTLHISSDFGRASLNMLYDSSNLQDLNVSFGVDLNDVDVVGFFNNFHKLLLKWPEMKNLSGTLNISIDGKAHVFPNMYINAPSLWANATIKGSNLKVHQNAFIRHLAHMLLINQVGPIDIEDIKFQAVVHSNLVEVFPTTFEVSKYKLVLMGLNNFNGDMFYHLGVEDWPLKIPFGVNIKGNYSHPVMRFGSKNWHDRNGALITGGVQDTENFNIIKASKGFGGEFIHSAASYHD